MSGPRDHIREAPNLKSAIYTAMGAASMCWKESPTGEFDEKSARAVAEALYDWVQDNQLTVEHSNGIIIHEGSTYYQDLLEVRRNAE